MLFCARCTVLCEITSGSLFSLNENKKMITYRSWRHSVRHLGTETHSTMIAGAVLLRGGSPYRRTERNMLAQHRLTKLLESQPLSVDNTLRFCVFSNMLTLTIKLRGASSFSVLARLSAPLALFGVQAALISMNETFGKDYINCYTMLYD